MYDWQIIIYCILPQKDTLLFLRLFLFLFEAFQKTKWYAFFIVGIVISVRLQP